MGVVYFVEENTQGNSFLQQTELMSAGYSFGAALNLQLIKNVAVMAFDGIQG
jgi:hypothetical protein